jgi:LPXTG-motif cell wall-anchored protein
LKKLAFIGFLLFSLLVFSSAAWAAVSSQTRVSMGSSNGPYKLVISNDGSNIFTTTNNSRSVFRITASNNSVSSPSALDSLPTAMAISPDDTKLFVGINNSFPSVVNEIVVLNPSNLNIINRIALTFRPSGIEVSPNGNFLYAVGGTKLFKISTSTYAINEISLSPSLSDAEDITISPNGQVAYISNFTSGALTVINLLTETTQATINIGGNLISAAISPNGNLVSVQDPTNHRISIVNTQTNLVVETIQSPSGSQPRFSAFSPDGSTLAVSHYVGDVTLYETTNWTLTDTLTPTMPKSLVGEVAFSPNGSTLWAAGQLDSALFRWEFTPPLAAPTPTPTPTPTSTSAPSSTPASLPATGVDTLPFFVVVGLTFLMGLGSLLVSAKLRGKKR